MKIAILSYCIILLLSSCSPKERYWEYKVISYNSDASRKGLESFQPASIIPSESGLSEMGAEGWEIVTSYLELETAFPNFGNDNYVMGIRENVRPQRLVIILKREKGLYKEKKE